MGWLDKDKWLAALTGFTPFGKGPLSVNWLKEHPRERNGLLAAAAIAGAAYTGGASLGLLGGAGGAAAGGAGAAGLGASGVAAGAAGTAGGLASAFGPTAATAGLLGTYAAPAAVTPMVTGVGAAGLSSLGAGGGAATFGPAAAAAESMGAFTGGPSAGLNWGKGLDMWRKSQQLIEPHQRKKPQMQPSPMPRGNVPDVYASEILKRIYGGM